MSVQRDISGGGEISWADDAPRGRPARLLGWGHAGFRLVNRRCATVALCLLLAIPFLADVSKVHVGGRLYPDLRLWRTVAADYMSDPSQSLYEKHTAYVYPPFFLTLIHPLCHLSDRAAGTVFAAIKWLSLLLSVRIAGRMASPPGEDVPPAVTLAGLLLTWRFIWNDLGHGNVNLLLLLCVLGGSWLAARNRPFLAGFVVAAAVCVKVTPALILVYFAYKGWWRAVVGAAVGVGVCLFVWPAFFLGWSANAQALTGWYNHVVAGYFHHGQVWSIHINQSIVAILNRLLGPSVAIDPDVHVALVVLPQWARDAIRLVLMLVILAGLAWVCRGRLHPQRQPIAFAAEVSLIQIAMLLLSGLTWKAHFVAMLLPYTVLAAFLADRRYMTAHRPRIVKLLWTSFVLCTLTSDVLGPVGANYAEAFGLIAMGAVAAGIALVMVRNHLRRSDVTGSSASAFRRVSASEFTRRGGRPRVIG